MDEIEESITIFPNVQQKSFKSLSKKRKVLPLQHSDDDDDDEEYNYDSADDHDSLAVRMHQFSMKERFNEFYRCSLLRYSNNRLLASTCNTLLFGKWNAFIQLAHCFFGLPSIPSLTICQFVVIAINRIRPIRLELNKNEFHQFIDEMIGTCFDKWELLLEVLIYLIKHSMFDQKSFIESMYNKIIKRKVRKWEHVSSDVLEKSLELFYEYFEFLEWKRLDQHSTFKAKSLTNELLSQKILNSLTNYVQNDYQHIHYDIAILMALEICEVNEDLNSGLHVLEVYVLNRPNHLNANIYLFEFLHRYPYLDNKQYRLVTLKTIVDLNPGSEYTLKLVELSQESTEQSSMDCIALICNFLDYNCNHNSKRGWKILHHLVKTETATKDVQQFFTNRLKYWKPVHFRLSKLNRILPTLKLMHQACLFNDDNDLKEDKLFDRHTSNVDNENFHDIYFVHIYKKGLLKELINLIEMSDNLKQYYQLLHNL